MSRIARVRSKQAGPLTRAILAGARRKTKQLAGRETEDMLEPLELYAHRPRLLIGYCMMEGATASLDRVDHRLKALAELKAATMHRCEYCIDIGSRIAHQAGITEAQLRALPHYRESEEFDDLEKLALDYAVAMSSTPVDVSEELFAGLRARFDDAQLVELTNIIALENMRGRFNVALGIGSSGLSEGIVCAVPLASPSEEALAAHAAS
jgi:4-carboxymuconolactone decarboxylase